MKSLPNKPNLDFLKKEAKKLRSLHRTADNSICPIVRHFEFSFTGKSDKEIFESKFSVLDAQRVVAREYGFSSWTKLKRFIESTHRKFNQKIHDELLELQDQDQAMRSLLLEQDVLYDGYHPKMLAVHEKNADRLNDIIDVYGWPGTSLVGLDGCRAAFLIAQHAISRPDFLRHCLRLLSEAEVNNEVPSRLVAYLADVINFHEQKPQVYGLVGWFDDNGEFSYGAIVDEKTVNQRRALAGLEPIESDRDKHKQQIQSEGGRAPKDPDNFNKGYNEWAKKTGWR